MDDVKKFTVLSTLLERQGPPFGCCASAYVQIRYSKTIARQADTEEVAPLIVRRKTLCFARWNAILSAKGRRDSFADSNPSVNFFGSFKSITRVNASLSLLENCTIRDC